MKVLHISLHIGGGVGKALSGLVEQSNSTNSEYEHIIACLEKPIDNQFVNKILKCNKKVIIQPSKSNLISLMKESDIVQLEWWGHPNLEKYLCEIQVPPIRLLTWCHKNGLYNTIIPKNLILDSHICLFTSQCSFQRQEIRNLIPVLEDRLGVVYSSGGFSDFPEPKNNIPNNEVDKNISVGYFGDLRVSKLHPDYINYLKEVNIPNFKVKMIGEKHNVDILTEQCKNIGKSNLFKFTGHVENPVDELKSINVLAYILNPNHYGTTENALLEAMSMGIVPVVLDNPAERCIVEHFITGIVVSNPKQFGEAIQWLYENPIERYKMGIQASKSVRERFSVENTESSLTNYYKKIMSMEKRKINFSEIFNTT